MHRRYLSTCDFSLSLSYKTLAVVGVVLLTSSCDTHVARIEPPPPLVVEKDQSAEIASTMLLIGSKKEKDLDHETVVRDPMPLDIPISCIRRDGAGLIWRYEGQATTATPWWQRFPDDMISDVLPWHFEVTTSATVTLVRVKEMDKDALFTEAQQAGYAHAPAAATNHGQHP